MIVQQKTKYVRCGLREVRSGGGQHGSATIGRNIPTTVSEIAGNHSQLRTCVQHFRSSRPAVCAMGDTWWVLAGHCFGPPATRPVCILGYGCTSGIGQCRLSNLQCYRQERMTYRAVGNSLNPVHCGRARAGNSGFGDGQREVRRRLRWVRGVEVLRAPEHHCNGSGGDGSPWAVLEGC